MTKIIIKDKKDQALLNYNKLGYLAPIMIEIIDYLKETNLYQKDFKFQINRALIECEKIVNKHYECYEDYGYIDQKEDELEPIHSQDIYNVTSKAYDEIFEFFTTNSPAEVVSILQAIKETKEKGLDFTQIILNYKPLKS